MCVCVGNNEERKLINWQKDEWKSDNPLEAWLRKCSPLGLRDPAPGREA